MNFSSSPMNISLCITWSGHFCHLHWVLLTHLPCGGASRKRSHHWLTVLGFIQTWLQLRCLPQQLHRPNHEAFPIEFSDPCSRSSGFISDKIGSYQHRARSLLTKMTGESDKIKVSISLKIRSPPCISKGYSAHFYRELTIDCCSSRQMTPSKPGLIPQGTKHSADTQLNSDYPYQNQYKESAASWWELLFWALDLSQTFFSFFTLS